MDTTKLAPENLKQLFLKTPVWGGGVVVGSFIIGAIVAKAVSPVIGLVVALGFFMTSIIGVIVTGVAEKDQKETHTRDATYSHNSMFPTSSIF